MAIKKSTQPCPCGGTDYAACCARFHSGDTATDASYLMRARYSAYVLKLKDYLLATWHPDTRPAQLELTNDKWLGLEVLQHKSIDADHETVEFIARYKTGGRAHRLHEISQFVREDGSWFYVDGQFSG
jgi:SEC-C motif-containing protein